MPTNQIVSHLDCAHLSAQFKKRFNDPGSLPNNVLSLVRIGLGVSIALHDSELDSSEWHVYCIVDSLVSRPPSQRGKYLLYIISDRSRPVTVCWLIAALSLSSSGIDRYPYLILFRYFKLLHLIRQ